MNAEKKRKDDQTKEMKKKSGKGKEDPLVTAWEAKMVDKKGATDDPRRLRETNGRTLGAERLIKEERKRRARKNLKA